MTRLRRILFVKSIDRAEDVEIGAMRVPCWKVRAEDGGSGTGVDLDCIGDLYTLQLDGRIDVTIEVPERAGEANDAADPNIGAHARSEIMARILRGCRRWAKNIRRAQR